MAETDGGLVIFNSCCHDGVVSILRDIAARFPGRPIRAVLGGFHLMGSGGLKALGPTPQQVLELAAALRDQLQVEEVYTGHCTGEPAFALLQQVLGPRLHRLTTGAVYTF